MAPERDPRIRGELLKVLYVDQRASLAAATVFAIAVAAVLAQALGTAAPWWWLAGILSVTAARFALAESYRRANPPPQTQARWERRFTFGALLMGMFWGSTGWFFYPAVPADYRAAVILVIGGIVAASSRSIAALLPAYYALALAAMLPLVLRGFFERTGAGAFMGFVSLVYMVFLMGVARNFRNTIAKSFRLGFENADLAAELRVDIAARQAAEKALRASEERLRLAHHALDNAQDLVIVVARTGEFLHANGAFCRYSGRSWEELAAGKVWMSLAALNASRFEDLWTEIRHCGTLTFETEVYGPEGEPQPVEISASHLLFDEREAVCMVGRDLRSRRVAEQEKARMQQQLQEAQKLESLGVLAGGIAHDFNNLLTAVLGNATLARDLLPSGSELRDPLTQIERAANQAAGLCRQMLAYAGKGRFVVEPVDLAALVADSAKLLEMSIGRRARLVLRSEEAAPPVLADASQMRQVVLNLVHNAAEAMPRPGGEIVVTTGRIRIDPPLIAAARVRSEIGLGEGACLEVRDNGSGMDQATLARIFEPFFTTKFTGRGLGLAAVLGIVRSHRALLLVESAPGQGAAFRLVLPAHAEARPAAAPAPSALPAPLTPGRALVIDDEDVVRLVARQSLERLGFAVETANDGEMAIARLAREPQAFELILLDMTMPRLDGVLTLQEIRRLRSRARVVLMSGLSEQQARERVVAYDVAAFLQKPFDLATLRAKVQSAMNGQGVAGDG